MSTPTDTSINILGEKWSIRYSSVAEDKTLETADGYADETSKSIVVRTGRDGDMDDFLKVQIRVLRHEIIHAYLFECGLGADFEHANKFGHDETMIDWIARMFPRILATYQELGVI